LYQVASSIHLYSQREKKKEKERKDLSPPSSSITRAHSPITDCFYDQARSLDLVLFTTIHLLILSAETFFMALALREINRVPERAKKGETLKNTFRQKQLFSTNETFLQFRHDFDCINYEKIEFAAPILTENT
jgi:hypothetical protein